MAAFCFAQFQVCPASNNEDKYNVCHYYFSGRWETMFSTGEPRFSPFEASCASYGVCHTFTSDTEKDEYHIYCKYCEDGYTKFSFPVDQGSCSEGGLSSSTPGICYKPEILGICPAGVTCHYIYNAGVVIKNEGELR